MDVAPDLRPPSASSGRTRNVTEMEKSFDTLQQEVNEFWQSKTISGLAWCTFWMVNIANTCALIYHVAPGWGWTTEVLGQDVLEGDVYGWYGLWYACWQLADSRGSRKPTSCSVVTRLEHVPDWWGGCQSMAVMSLAFGLACLVFLCLYMFNSGLNRRLKMLYPFIVCAIISGVCGLVLFIVFCTLFLNAMFWCCHPDLVREILDWKLWYCFYLCGLATTLYLAAGIAGVFEVFEVMRMKRKVKAYTGWLERQDEFTELGSPLPFEFLAPNPFSDPYHR